MQTKPRQPRGLIYLGGGSLTGIPARDLSPDDLERLVKHPYVQRRYTSSATTLETKLANVLVDGDPIYRTPSKPSSDAKE